MGGIGMLYDFTYYNPTKIYFGKRENKIEKSRLGDFGERVKENSTVFDEEKQGSATAF